MSLSDCASCVKFVLFAFNFIFWLIGCVLVGVGIFVRVDSTVSMLQSGCNSSYVHLYTAAYILIIVGAAIMVLGFLGCCGAMRESPCLLILFAISLFLIFGVLVAAGIWAIIDKSKIDAAVDEHLDNAVRKYYTDDTCKLLVDQIQNELHCCGATKGVNDYTTPLIPLTCKPKFYENPCNEPIKAYLEKYLVVVAGVFIGVGIVMLFGALMSLVLCCGVRAAHRRDTDRYK